MRLQRTGSQRNAGTTTLFADHVANRKHFYAPQFNAEQARFSVGFYGEDRNSTYDYRLSMGADELIRLLEIAYTSIPDTASRALLRSSLATLKELLPQPQPTSKSTVR
jgi:hypothetical protein